MGWNHQLDEVMVFLKIKRYMSSDQLTLVVFRVFFGDDILPSYMGIVS